tara:strand:- start:159 stop:413 length:255 start_codon:yes stop_codon:yes gene_type:complete
MSTELLIKENIKKTKLDPSGSDKTRSDPQISNFYLNKLNYKKSKTCINKLQEKLREKEVKQKFENRIVYGIFFSLVAVLFYVST